LDHRGARGRFEPRNHASRGALDRFTRTVRSAPVGWAAARLTNHRSSPRKRIRGKLAGVDLHLTPSWRLGEASVDAMSGFEELI
jgi:hypothetical protein